MVIEMEKNKKNLHSFLSLKRFIEKDIERKIDIGFGLWKRLWILFGICYLNFAV